MPSRKPKDVVLVHGRTKDGKGLGVLRARNEQLEIGTMRPLEDGQPIQGGGEVVKLTPRADSPILFDAETQFVAEGAPAAEKTDTAAPRRTETPAASAGPPQVASDTYRKNWDTIWKRPGKREKLFN